MAKRKPRLSRHLSRKRGRKQPSKRILIVCEGELTERLYFLSLINYRKIKTAKVIITGDCGSDPVSIFKHAKKLHEREEALGNPYDSVYCVFDRDSHTNYQDAINRITSFRTRKTKFTAITSNPCFEYWYILHFTLSTRAYNRTQRKSSGDHVQSHLKTYMQDYSKSKDDMFVELLPRLDTAIINSKKVLEDIAINGENPSTKVHILIENLHKVKASQKK